MNHKLSVFLLLSSGLFFAPTKSSEWDSQAKEHAAEARKLEQTRQRTRKNPSAVSSFLHQGVNDNSDSFGYSREKRGDKHRNVGMMDPTEQRSKYDRVMGQKVTQQRNCADLCEQIAAPGRRRR